MARRKVTRGSPPRLAQSRRRNRSQGSAANDTRHTRSGDDPETTLGVYFREMSDLDLMTPQEELASAIRIHERRTEYWKALLAYPPFTDGIAELLGTKLGEEELPEQQLCEVRSSSRDLRDRDTRANHDAFEASTRTLAEALAHIDTDGVISDLIAADLEALSAGYRNGLNLRVRPPRSGSKPFRVYAGRVRRASAGLRAEKNAFVKKNLRLVVSIARRFNHGRMPLQDLIQEGNIGLMKAVDRFDYRKGFRFSTYGSWWIRHAISRAIADKARAVRLPVHMLEAHHKVTKARRELETLHGREPTNEELAAHTGLALAKIEKMDTLLVDPPVSLERKVSSEDDRTVEDLLHDQTAEIPGEQIEADGVHEQVRSVILGLRPIEADILRRRFGLDESDQELTLKQIGERYSLSRERIRQLQEQALGKVRQELLRRDAV